DAASVACFPPATGAGARDTVTVVYAEGPDFARAVRGRSSSGAPAAPPRIPDRPVDQEPPQREANSHAAARFFHWIVHSRTTWFAIGAIAGVLGTLFLLVWRTPET